MRWIITKELIMLDWVGRVVFFVAALLLSALGHAIDFEAQEYEVYYGDFNNDGSDDIYVRPKDKIILIHGDIAIPIPVASGDGYVYYAGATNNPHVLNLSQSQVDNYTLAVLGQHYQYEDVNGDGELDLVVNVVGGGGDTVVFEGGNDQCPSQSATGTGCFPGSNDMDNDGIPNELDLCPNTPSTEAANTDGCSAPQRDSDDILTAGMGSGPGLAIINKKGISQGYSPEEIAKAQSIPASKPYHIPTMVGTSSGEFRVSEGGAATYNIPFLLPGGTADVTPNLALSYSSGAGNGVAGVGWNLSGAGAISRCRQTLSQDGSSKPVSFSSDDRFCLNGQRLLVADGVEYGAVGAFYQSEINSFAIIQSHGGSVGHPSYFTVIAKDGTMTTYGGSENNLQRTQTHNYVYSWLKNEEVDSTGINKIRYTYWLSPNKVHYLSSVEYAYGNTETAHSKVSFSYEQRPDVSTSYIDDAIHITDYRLERVAVHNRYRDGASYTLLRRYYLAYQSYDDTYTGTHLSRLQRVQECAGGTTDCYEPITFEWSDKLPETGFGSGQTITSFPHVNIDGMERVDYKYADFNGDGHTDLAAMYAEYNDVIQGYQFKIYYKLTNPETGKLDNVDFYSLINSQTREYIQASHSPGFGRFEIIDYNADGRSDLAVGDISQDQETISWKIYVSTPTVIDGKTQWRLSLGPVGEVLDNLSSSSYFMDLNGDSLVDLVEFDEVVSVRHLEKRPNATVTSFTSYEFGDIRTIPIEYPSKFPEQYSKVEALVPAGGDFNGDGSVDFVITLSYLNEDNCDFNNPEADNTNCGVKRTETIPYVFIDEKLAPYYDSLTVARYDTRFATSVDLKNFQSPDINGDGLSDLLYTSTKEDDIHWHYSFNTGSGFTEAFTLGNEKDRKLQLVDVNNDSYLDLMWFEFYQKIVHQTFPDGSEDATEINGGVYFSPWDAASQSFGAQVRVDNGPIANNTYYYNPFFMDVNGDGHIDLIHEYKNPVSNEYESYAYYNIAQGTPHLINGFSNGAAYTSVQYELLSKTENYQGVDVAPEANSAETTICYTYYGSTPSEHNDVNCVAGQRTYYTDNTFYSQLNGAWDLGALSTETLGKSSPVIEVTAPIPVVTRVQSKVSQSESVALGYYYQEAKMQAAGRGFLGFKKLSTIDEQTGVLTTTQYRQDFPFSGQPFATHTYSPDGKLLKSSDIELKLQGFENSWKDTAATSGTVQLGSLQPYISKAIDTTYRTSVDGTIGTQVTVYDDVIHKETAEFTYDTFGNLLTNTVTVEGSDLNQTKTTTNTYSGSSINLHGQSLSAEQLGRLDTAIVIGTRNGETITAKDASFSYYTSGNKAGLLKTESIAGDPSDLHSTELSTTHDYDNFGRPVSTTVLGWAGAVDFSKESRTSLTHYDDQDSSARLVIGAENALQQQFQTVELSDRNAYGAPTRISHANGVISSTAFDAFGREIAASSNAGQNSASYTEYLFCGSEIEVACPDEAVWVKRNSTDISQAVTLEYFDALGRVIQVASTDFSGDWVLVASEFDLLGRVKRQSEPYYQGATAQFWTEYTYDYLGRVLVTRFPDGTENRVKVDGQTTTLINQLGHTKTEVKNAFDEVVYVYDNQGLGDYAYMEYEYDAEGRLGKAKVYSSASTTEPIVTDIDYDYRGRKTSMTDPDKGHWQYTYNAFSELLTQIDAKGQSTANQYDILGRQVSRTDYASTGAVEGHTTWYFDGKTDVDDGVQANALGQTSAIILSGSIADITCGSPSAQHCSYMRFDTLGRAKSTSMSMKVNSIWEHYSNSVVYNGLTGRADHSYDALNQVVLRDGVAITSGLKSTHNDYGHLEQVEDLDTGDVIYKVMDKNARNQVQVAQLGGLTQTQTYSPATGRIERIKTDIAGIFSRQNIAYEWDAVGNLLYRFNSGVKADGQTAKNEAESFCYDKLNRLIKTNFGTTDVSSCSGLQVTDQDVEYDNLGNIQRKAGAGIYAYGPTASSPIAGPHAVTSADGVTYRYDQNGNMVSDSSGRTMVYASFDKPTSLSKGSHQTDFKYGPGRSRYLRVDTNNSVAEKNEITRYLGGVERITRSSGIVEWKRYLSDAVFTYTTDASNDIDMLVGEAGVEKAYILKDHLGSPDLILDDLGNLVSSGDQSFDAWGARRDSATIENGALAQSALSAFDTRTTKRGFTGHEMLDDLGLVHMNGRIYDPKLARFMQADPFVQSAMDTQMYNRYSYVRNNPLNATDPSGYIRHVLKSVFKEGKRASRSVIAEMIRFIGPDATYIVGMMLSSKCGSWAPVCAAAFSYDFNRVRGASSRQAFYSASIAAVTTKAFQEIGKQFGTLSANNLEGAGVSPGASDAVKDAAMSKAGFIKFGGNYLGSGQVAAQIAAHAVVGGIIAEVQGGKFGHGFIAAGFTKGLTNAQLGAYNQAGGVVPGLIAGTAVAAAIGGTASVLSGGKFSNGARTASYQFLFNQAESAIRNSLAAQKGNPATGIANKATQDGRLTLGEANEVWRANNDPSFELTVDASQLTVLQTSEFNDNGIASGRIPYSETGDWLVHGSVTLSRNGDGVISIRPGGYDFQPHTPVRTFMTGVRNVETYGGFYVASRAGFSVGTDYLINYSGSPNVVR